MEIEIKFKTPASWISSLVETHSARIKIRDIRRSEEGVKDLVEIFSPMGKIQGVSSDLVNQKMTQDRHFTMVDDSHATAIVDANGCAICSTILNWDLFLVEANSDDYGDVIMRWLVPDENTASGFLSRLEEDGVKFELVKKRNLSKRGDITARQEFVVKTALDLGFFDYPKKVNLEGLSKRLNVSYVTLAEILRRAEKHIISSYFKKNAE
ncbi:MAG: helix-turn-helix domain-containing protein [Thermoplasmataceae archaeon]